MSWQCRCGAHNDKAALACEGCGHEPNVVPTGAKSVRAVYREPPERTYVREEISPELRAMIRQVAGSLEVAAPKVRERVDTFKRCAACETGRFLHAGVTFCLACFRAL